MSNTLVHNILDEVIIRDSVTEDILNIQEIYAHEVLTNFSTLDTDPPSVQKLSERRDYVLSYNLPYIVAEWARKVIAYAYVVPTIMGTASTYVLEDSVYVAESYHGKGVGKKILTELLRRCDHMAEIAKSSENTVQIQQVGWRWRSIIAVIGSRSIASVGLHSSVGFKKVAHLKSVGFKHGKWCDVIHMQRFFHLQ